MRNAECGMRNLENRVGEVRRKCRMRISDCGMGVREEGMRIVDFGLRNDEWILNHEPVGADYAEAHWPSKAIWYLRRRPGSGWRRLGEGSNRVGRRSIGFRAAPGGGCRGPGTSHDSIPSRQASHESRTTIHASRRRGFGGQGMVAIKVALELLARTIARVHMVHAANVADVAEDLAIERHTDQRDHEMRSPTTHGYGPEVVGLPGRERLEGLRIDAEVVQIDAAALGDQLPGPGFIDLLLGGQSPVDGDSAKARPGTLLLQQNARDVHRGQDIHGPQNVAEPSRLLGHHWKLPITKRGALQVYDSAGNRVAMHGGYRAYEGRVT